MDKVLLHMAEYMAYHKVSDMLGEEWAYHATDPAKLPSIAKDGLVPQEQPEERGDEDRADDEALVFFSSAERYARVWGSEMLRFPWPDECWDDPYGDSMWDEASKSVINTNLCTPRWIPPEQIEIKKDGNWMPIQQTSSGTLDSRGIQIAYGN